MAEDSGVSSVLFFEQTVERSAHEVDQQGPWEFFFFFLNAGWSRNLEWKFHSLLSAALGVQLLPVHACLQTLALSIHLSLILHECDFTGSERYTILEQKMFDKWNSRTSHSQRGWSEYCAVGVKCVLSLACYLVGSLQKRVDACLLSSTMPARVKHNITVRSDTPSSICNH